MTYLVSLSATVFLFAVLYCCYWLGHLHGMHEGIRLCKKRHGEEALSAIHNAGCPSIAKGIIVGNCCEVNDRVLQTARKYQGKQP